MLALQSARVGTGHDEEGLLVFAENRLVAVLVRLSETNEIAPGQWFLETGFGRLGGGDHPTFADLDAAQDWIEEQLSGEPQGGSREAGSNRQ